MQLRCTGLLTGRSSRLLADGGGRGAEKRKGGSSASCSLLRLTEPAVRWMAAQSTAPMLIAATESDEGDEASRAMLSYHYRSSQLSSSNSGWYSLLWRPIARPSAVILLVILFLVFLVLLLFGLSGCFNCVFFYRCPLCAFAAAPLGVGPGSLHLLAGRARFNARCCWVIFSCVPRQLVAQSRQLGVHVIRQLRGSEARGRGVRMSMR